MVNLMTENYDKTAEELLSKAVDFFVNNQVKLSPTNDQMWVELGEIMWKKKDIQAAKKCFETAQQNVSFGFILQNPKNKEALQNLSIVLKQIGENSISAFNYDRGKGGEYKGEH